MPITEAPRPEPPTEGESPARALRGRASRRGAYDELESYDLLHVIDELEDDRSRALLREKIWLALILHLLLFGFIIFSPKYLWNVHVREVSPDKQKKMTYLDLPPDALKQLKPNKPAPLSDKNRQQQSPHPAPVHKTLQELEAMRRAGPPTKTPAPNRQPKPTPLVAQARPAPPQPKPQPAPPPTTSQSAQIEAPKPQPTKPNFATPRETAGQQIAQAAKQAEQGAQSYGGDMGANAPSVHSGQAGPVDILSNTLGVDFGPYIRRVIYDTKRAWYPIIPAIAQPPISKQGRVLIRFKILPDGSVVGMKLEGPSGDVSLDRAAWGGITGGGYPPLPKNFKGPFLELRFSFLYNENPGVQ